MKRYKLKKDLPTFKAGEEFHISPKGNLIADNKDIIAYAKTTLQKFPNILTDWFEEIPERPKTVAGLRDGDIYYIIQNDGSVCCSIWTNDGVDKGRAEIGNVFLTEEGAERELARSKAKRILLQDTNGYKPDLKDSNSPKYHVYYSIDNDRLVAYEERYIAEDKIYFASSEDAMASIRKHRKEWLTYFGVEK